MLFQKRRSFIRLVTCRCFIHFLLLELRTSLLDSLEEQKRKMLARDKFEDAHRKAQEGDSDNATFLNFFASPPPAPSQDTEEKLRPVSPAPSTDSNSPSSTLSVQPKKGRGKGLSVAKKAPRRLLSTIATNQVQKTPTDNDGKRELSDSEENPPASPVDSQASTRS